MKKEDLFHLGAKALIYNTEGKLLLLQCRPSNAFGDMHWDIPGGRVHINESLEEALRRELYEELGIQEISQLKPLMMCRSNIRIPVPNGDVGLILAIYLCDIANESPIHLSGEHTRVEWVEPGKAAELLSVNFPAELTDKIAQLVSKNPA